MLVLHLKENQLPLQKGEVAAGVSGWGRDRALATAGEVISWSGTVQFVQ